MESENSELRIYLRALLGPEKEEVKLMDFLPTEEINQIAYDIRYNSPEAVRKNLRERLKELTQAAEAQKTQTEQGVENP